MAGKAIRTGRDSGYSGFAYQVVVYRWVYKNSDCEYPFRKFTATSVDRILVNHFLILCLTDSIVKAVKEVEKH
jgi:hypothetical protein